MSGFFKKKKRFLKNLFFPSDAFERPMDEQTRARAQQQQRKTTSRSSVVPFSP